MLSRADLARLVAEAGPALAGAVVHRVWRRDDDTFVLLLRFEEGHEPERIALELGLLAEGARLVALPPEDVDADDPAEKKSRKEDSHFFVGALRKHLIGCRVAGLTHVAGDRIALLDLEPPTDAPPTQPLPAPRGEELRLAIELTGRVANLVLVERGADGDRVLLGMRPGRSGRELDPGTAFTLPNARAANPDAEEPVFAPEIAPDPKTLALSRAFARAAREAEEERDNEDRRAQLLRAATHGEKRSRGLVTKLEKERAEAQAAELLRQEGELLKANAQSVKKGATSIRVMNYFLPEPREIEIEIDPLVPVMDQARARFKRAKKLDRGLVAIETRLGAADAEAEALTRIRAALEAASPDDEGALDAAEKELQKLGCAPKAKAPPPKKREKEVSTGPRQFFSRDGFEILVGRSNEENDRLTIQMARGNDLFFHVRGFPGSHVIVRNQPNKTVPLETLLDAGALAVHYSKVRGNTRADVSYTPRKYVKKPRGAKPGLVEIANEKTIRPDGDPERLARVLSTARNRDVVEDAFESS
jgi:predicted ribosome quality control (RQC) complex YloA/Tae2 family protein